MSFCEKMQADFYEYVRISTIGNTITRSNSFIHTLINGALQTSLESAE